METINNVTQEEIDKLSDEITALEMLESLEYDEERANKLEELNKKLNELLGGVENEEA